MRGKRAKEIRRGARIVAQELAELDRQLIAARPWYASLGLWWRQWWFCEADPTRPRSEKWLAQSLKRWYMTEGRHA